MSRVLPALISEVRALMLSALPDLSVSLKQNGIYAVTHVDRIPFSELSVPYGVIECDDMGGQNTNGDFGPANDAYLISINAYIVLEQKWDALDLMGYLEDLRDVIAQHEFTSVNTLISLDRVSASNSLTPNNFYAQGNFTTRAGLVGFTVAAIQSLNG